MPTSHGHWLIEDQQENDSIGSGRQVPEPTDYGSLQAAVSLDKERGLAPLAGRLLLALLELAVPVKVQVLPGLRSEGRNIRAYQREEPDDLQQARQELEALLSQIQPEPYRFYERWEVLLSSDRGTRRTGSLEQAQRFGARIQLILDRITYSIGGGGGG
jgi:hypothetical protein